MGLALLNILLALAWILLTGVFTPANLVGGFLLSFLVLWLVSSAAEYDQAYLKRIRKIPAFIIFILFELAKANLRVALEVLTPGLRIRPGIVAVPLHAEKDLEIALLANLITLTPGTLSIDVSDDRKTLYVHAIYADNPNGFRWYIKQKLEKRLLEIMR